MKITKSSQCLLMIILVNVLAIYRNGLLHFVDYAIVKDYHKQPLETCLEQHKQIFQKWNKASVRLARIWQKSSPHFSIQTTTFSYSKHKLSLLFLFPERLNC